MSEIGEQLTERILRDYPRWENRRELISAFAEYAAPTVQFLDEQGLPCKFLLSHVFGQGWSFGFVTTSEPSGMVVRKWDNESSYPFEVTYDRTIQSGIDTPQKLLDFTREKFGGAAPIPRIAPATPSGPSGVE